MKINLTHEQADFDAIASLLGAKILAGDTISVLPRKTNKNVRDFLHLYNANLPFIQPDEISNEPIELVTLVDTQSLVTLRGLTKQTIIKMIDHHEIKSRSEENDFTPVPFGACTTYFIEQIKDSHHQLTPIEATLMLLGIYEDTGMLTYTNTTPQDAAAVSYLLSNGANLEIAAKFLNPPLSSEQQITFQALMENAISISIEGLAVLVTYCHAPDLDDEISSIAHKINDLLDPDALFVFVMLKEGIRLVARSSSNQINTATIAKQYNGGGHRRAAAALIKTNKTEDKQLEKLVDEFITIIPEFVHPAMKVSELMSKKPLTLEPSTTLSEARKFMERYGYEGFPVIEDGKIIGLLNRRAVDKAVAHNLKKDVSSLLEAGSFCVTPDDSINHLQRIMAESGWGQIPVVDPNSKEVIGIATRTDLLKILTSGSRPSKALNLAEAIQRYIPAGQYELLKLISKTTAELNIPLYIVGGFVRDIILKKNSPDLDLVVEGDAIELANRLVDTYGGKVTSHKKFGTAKWWPTSTENSTEAKTLSLSKEIIKDIPETIDFISARTEFYERPTALPTIKKGSIKLDLHRRDFTINTLAARLDGIYFGDVYDYWGGLTDIENKKIRVLHSLSFVDDPTRILRAVRFEQRFDFEIEKRTLELLDEAIPLLDEVSGDRIRHELDQIFMEDNVIKPMKRLFQLGILKQIHPALSWNMDIEEDIARYETYIKPYKTEGFFEDNGLETTIQAYYLILLSMLAPFELENVIKRLRFNRNFQKLVLAANNLWFMQENYVKLPPGEFTEEIEKYPPLAVMVNKLLSKNKQFVKMLDAYILDWRKIKVKTTGNDLKQYDIPPGPLYRSILRNLRIAKINGDFSTDQEEKKALENLISRFT